MHTQMTDMKNPNYIQKQELQDSHHHLFEIKIGFFCIVGKTNGVKMTTKCKSLLVFHQCLEALVSLSRILSA